MKNIFRKAAALLIAGFMCVASFAFSASAESSRQKLPEDDAMTFVDSMGAGWNLGNAFDAWDWSRKTKKSNELDWETAWCGAKTTKELIRTVKNAGFRTIRIPVTWLEHVDSNFNISSKWMNRVKEVIDWCIEEDLYVILDAHHDVWTGYYYPVKSELSNSKKYLTKIWQQISDTFKNYSDKLVFEIINEPRIRNSDNSDWIWWYNINGIPSEIKDALDCINQLNQAALDTIRASGGKNKERYVLVGGYATGHSDLGILSPYFKMPTDTVKNRIIADVHYYGIGAKSSLSALEDIYKKYTANGIPIVITEYGLNHNGYKYSDNTDIAVKRMSEFVSYARDRGISVVLWDNNYGGKGISTSHKFIDRATAKVITPEIVEAVVKAGAPAIKTTSSSTKTTSTGRIKVTAKIYSDKVKLSWGAVEGATNYAIYQYKDGVYKALSKKLTKTYVTIKGLKAGTNYKFLVRAYVNGKWTSVSSKDVVSITTTK